MPDAQASPDQEIVIQDDHRLLEGTRKAQTEALAELDRLGVDRIRAGLWWGWLVGGTAERRRPAGNPRKPGSSLYRRGRWAMVDRLVRGARRRGIEITLNPTAASGLPGTHMQVPRWAQRRSHAPEPAEFEHFVRAIGRRYSGDYRPAGAASPLPAVSEWSIWNEPNNPQFLRPQWRRSGRRWIPWSPVLYRRIYVRAARALRASGHGDHRIYFGETASMGAVLGRRGLASLAPGIFVRELACLGPRLLPYRGAAARRRGCTGYRPLDTDGLATHFYSAADGTAPALRVEPHGSHWTPGDPSRPAKLLARIAERGRLPAGLPVLGSEAGFQSRPSVLPGDLPFPRGGAPSRAHASVGPLGELNQSLEINLAEYLQWREPSVASFAQYLLLDDPWWFTGLRYIDGRAKSAYAAFRMPIVVRRAEAVGPGGAQVIVWGAASGRRSGRRVRILRDGLPVAEVVTQQEAGYFEVIVPEFRPGAVFRLEDPLTGARSRGATVTPGI